MFLQGIVPQEVIIGFWEIKLAIRAYHFLPFAQCLSAGTAYMRKKEGNKIMQVFNYQVHKHEGNAPLKILFDEK